MERNRIPMLKVDASWPNRFWPVPFGVAAWRIARYIRKGRIDLIHCNGENDYWIGRIAGRLTDRPVLCHLHCQKPPEYCRWMFRRQPARLLCVSQALADLHRDALRNVILPDHVRVLHNSVDVEEFRPMPDGARTDERRRWGIPEDAYCLGVVASIKRHKQCLHLPKLMARPELAGLNVVGLLAGPVHEEDYRLQIAREIEERGLADRIVWTGNVADMPRLYAACDLVLSFSKGEAFSVAVLEALACGKPVVSYDHPALVEGIGDAGLTVPMGDIGRMARAVADLLRNRALREELGNRARQRALDHFASAPLAEKLRHEYDAVLAEHTAWGGKGP